MNSSSLVASDETGYVSRRVLSSHLSDYAVLSFVALLACIAVMPLAAPHFWESNRNKSWVVAALSLPVAAYLASRDPTALQHALGEYASFMALLGSLYIVAGGIHLSGDL